MLEWTQVTVLLCPLRHLKMAAVSYSSSILISISKTHISTTASRPSTSADMSVASSLLLPLLFLSLVSVSKSDELHLLLNLKTALIQESHSEVFKSWDASRPICEFSGITCNSDNSVKEIELSNQNLTGVLPFDSICKLHSLDRLSLGYNSLHGLISDDLNNCTNLQYLDLGNNFFSGSFPDISALAQLQHLHLNQSGFTGVFPWKSLASMTNLVSLSLGDNPFNRGPFPIEIVRLKKLNWLYLNNCGLEGTVPESIGDLVELINLELSVNFLTGEIPSLIGNLQNLWQLELYNNSFSGKLPSGLRNLTKLENFDVSMNYLEGDLSELRFLTNLVSLQGFDNNFSGEIPPEIGGFKKLVNVSLYSNKLTGPLPPQIGSWSKFDFIDVSENFLSGPIPPDMCKQGTMRGLLMLQNNFSGQIPSSYANCKTLKRFRVSKNSLSGTFPAGIWGLPQVNIIDIEFNQIHGPVASDIGKAQSLSQLFLGNNRLSGKLPEEISQAASLVAINLNDNQFSGELPKTIGNLKYVDILDLQNNMFSGSIPESIGSCGSLSSINMANNSLSGEIPASLGSLPTLNSLNLAGNKLSGLIPETLSSLRLSLLDLSHNRLSGPVPPSLSIEAYNGSFIGNSGLCSQTISFFPRCLLKSGMSKEAHTVILCLAVVALILLVSFACYLKLRKSEKNHERSLKEESWDVKSYHVLSFSEDDILDSIKEENLIGKGGSGSVYKVAVANGKELAVKHIWNPDSARRKKHRSTTPILGRRREVSKEFDAEVETLSSIRHVGVVKLYCSITSDDSSLLVYEYMPNGSLWDRLHSSHKMELDWQTRHEIAVGAAKGLEYLHHGCSRPIIHRDVKSSNILLDEFLKPRIADFGLAKIAQASSGKDSTHIIAGTLGYIAPEYGYAYKVDEKSDVYSFGVVLMELVSGKRPMEPEFGDNKDIVDWISSKLKTKESVFSIVDSRIPQSIKEDAIKVLRIAILCTSRSPKKRPTMRSVVQMLEEAEPCKLVNIVITKEGSDDKKEVKDKMFNPYA